MTHKGRFNTSFRPSRKRGRACMLIVHRYSSGDRSHVLYSARLVSCFWKYCKKGGDMFLRWVGNWRTRRGSFDAGICRHPDALFSFRCSQSYSHELGPETTPFLSYLVFRRKELHKLSSVRTDPGTSQAVIAERSTSRLHNVRDLPPVSMRRS